MLLCLGRSSLGGLVSFGREKFGVAALDRPGCCGIPLAHSPSTLQSYFISLLHSSNPTDRTTLLSSFCQSRSFLFWVSLSGLADIFFFAHPNPSFPPSPKASVEALVCPSWCRSAKSRVVRARTGRWRIRISKDSVYGQMAPLRARPMAGLANQLPEKYVSLDAHKTGTTLICLPS
jgi:hypothetical protein